ncbi:Protein KRTCAP2 -like protein [Sarcoptes scabiei]|nr:Protein KRTCAP2 -like protein [Sarcoptes scabiei]
MKMAITVGQSCFISTLLSLIVMAFMQVFRQYLISTKLTTLSAGYLGSLIFMLVLTSINNFEASMFGKHFQAKYFEVIISLSIAMFSSGLVHQVAATSCLLFSLITLYFLNSLSVKTYQQPTQTLQTSKNSTTKKKR